MFLRSARPACSALALVVAAGLCLAPLASRADDISGHVIVARTTDDALLIWDSSTEVAAIVAAKSSDADANARLEHDALHVLSQNVSKLGSSAKTVTVRVVYYKTGAVSPVYGAPTLAGVERYATLTMPASDAASDKDKWKELDDKAAAPSWVEFKILGQLPPR